jgi:hypothetical protein
VATVNEAVLHAIEEHVLTPKAVEAIVLLSEQYQNAQQQASLERERLTIGKKIARLVAAIEHGGEIPTLVSKLRELEARQTAVADELAGSRPIPRLDPGVVEQQLAEFRRLLRSNVVQARVVLDRVLARPLVFTPLADGSGYRFKAPMRFAKLFPPTEDRRFVCGVAAKVPAWLQQMPVEGLDGMTPEDTMVWAGDPELYGELLDKVLHYVGVASPRGAGRITEIATPIGRLHVSLRKKAA